MVPFQHILVPVDFGDTMQAGVDLAVALARKLDAQITLVHAFDVTPFTPMTQLAPTVDLEPFLASAQEELDAALAKLRAAWPVADAILCRGPACEAILETARVRGSDLIVIGTHGRHGMARVLLGSVAERIVRSSPIPVLTVHTARAAERTASAA